MSHTRTVMISFIQNNSLSSVVLSEVVTTCRPPTEENTSMQRLINQTRLESLLHKAKGGGEKQESRAVCCCQWLSKTRKGV
ncbi:hypothetical protein CHS0354_020399 [Potamilus streckersoni]|uniref:Uncharacterized protein n=1 Tax=Potamilus streckersoni TaxID=2493646 RepID=A0AAE0WBS7_9BIVA|nr:hypothetical protein CHS0354_020399 [Potamilus streckersoni]